MTSLPSPRYLTASHLALAALAVAPLALRVPTNANIVLTACATVLLGALRSVKPEPPADAMTKKDAMKFPLVGSIVLFSLFLCFKLLPKELVNKVLAAYFVLLGMLALVASLEPLVAPWAPAVLTDRHAELKLRPVSWLPGLKEGLDWSATLLELALGLASAAFCCWYVLHKHWWANNALGLAFSIQGIEHLSLGAVQNGVILLCGLFFYDIFWVFGTPVMVSVAKNLDAPIKLLFPRWLEDTAAKAPFSMLGLGDIVIPGIFVALVLRYDAANAWRTTYFRAAFGGYTAGLVATIAVMNIFQAAQPALLYIVPGVLLATFGHASLNGDFTALLHWHEHEPEEVEDEAGAGGWLEAAWQAVFGGTSGGKNDEADMGKSEGKGEEVTQAASAAGGAAPPSPAKNTRAAVAAAAAAAKKDV